MNIKRNAFILKCFQFNGIFIMLIFVQGDHYRLLREDYRINLFGSVHAFDDPFFDVRGPGRA
mgnify:CR=1 FL=1